MSDPRQGELWRTVRGIPTEISVGEDEGLPAEGAASFDNLQPVNRRLLTLRTRSTSRIWIRGGSRPRVWESWRPDGRLGDDLLPGHCGRHPLPGRGDVRVRDLYVPPGGIGLWQGAMRDASEDIHSSLVAVATERQGVLDRPPLHRPARRPAHDQPLRDHADERGALAGLRRQALDPRHRGPPTHRLTGWLSPRPGSCRA